MVGGSLVMQHQGSRVAPGLPQSQPLEDVHTPSGSRDLDEAAQDARGSMTPEALLPQTGERERTPGGARHWPHTAPGA